MGEVARGLRRGSGAPAGERRRAGAGRRPGRGRARAPDAGRGGAARGLQASAGEGPRAGAGRLPGRGAAGEQGSCACAGECNHGTGEITVQSN